MRICLLGGTRFVGRAVFEHLARAGHDLLVVHRGHSEPDELPPAQHLHIDRDRLELEASRLRAFAPEAVVDTYAMTAEHAEAALAGVPGELPRVVLSSMDVYRAYTSLLAGRHTDPVPLSEDAPLREQRYPYRGQDVPGADFDVDRYEKLDVEERYLEHGAVVLRLGFVYGEHDPQRREDFILRRVRAGRERIPFGSGGWIVSRTYVGDVGRAVERALEVPAARGEIFNICEQRSPTVRLWAEQILDAADTSSELVRVPDDRLPPDLALTGSAQPLLACSGKARSVLGWQESDPQLALNRSIAWHLTHAPDDRGISFDADDASLRHAA
jgi:nucleoside-diphosphate-sugar epimerase